uniref:Uncharacterized protein n=1 Tax=Cannabis sativa TaxID=3483 RepID=A0A803Q9B1_CANSA
MMILPRKVLRSIEAICRAFLWKGQTIFHGTGSIAWSNICQPKSAGGLGIKNLEHWNKAAMGKDQEWWSCLASIHASWYWKKIIDLKDQIQMLTDAATFQRQKYTIDAAYNMFSTSTDRGVKDWLKIHAQACDLQKLVRWIGKSRFSKFRKQMFSVAIAALVYQLWKARNALLWQKKLAECSRIIEEVKWTTKTRVTMLMPRKVKSIDREWFLTLGRRCTLKLEVVPAVVKSSQRCLIVENNGEDCGKLITRKMEKQNKLKAVIEIEQIVGNKEERPSSGYYDMDQQQIGQPKVNGPVINSMEDVSGDMEVNEEVSDQVQLGLKNGLLVGAGSQAHRSF